jgi:Protein of unknown function (DUF2442)
MEESMILVHSVKPLDEFKVLVCFSTGEQKVIDLQPFLRGVIFEPVRQNPSFFRTVHVDEESGTLCWDNGADIDPDVLYGSYQPAWQEIEVTSS